MNRRPLAESRIKKLLEEEKQQDKELTIKKPSYLEKDGSYKAYNGTIIKEKDTYIFDYDQKEYEDNGPNIVGAFMTLIITGVVLLVLYSVLTTMINPMLDTAINTTSGADSVETLQLYQDIFAHPLFWIVTAFPFAIVIIGIFGNIRKDI